MPASSGRSRTGSACRPGVRCASCPASATRRRPPSPLALAEALAAHRLRPGARTVLTAFGGGLTWASAALAWPQLAAVRSEI
ncbi:MULTISPECIES: 3-oxoacyl-[acyl-carrier-protein] synthase III C-terminal domain-containing protein [unclassified Streptomyces]|uniref:3-oxoacyl-[acyl-carrier-protein] synthase III C-terminal domain-containing protein n=1 Tax=unclassified Streptomyces TaxID=2593676 RepID=UPI00381D15EE